MDLRMLEINLPGPEAGKAREYIEGCPVLSVWEIPLASDGRILIKVLVQTRYSQSLLDRMAHHFVKPDGEVRMVLLPVSATVPSKSAVSSNWPSRLLHWRRRNLVSREELHEAIDDAAEFSSTYLVLVLLSTLVAAIGLLGNDAAVIIGAMVIAPLLGPNIALSLATCLGDGKLARDSMRTQGVGLLLALILSMFIGALLPFWNFPAPDQLLEIEQIRNRTTVEATSVALALVAGTAGALAFATGSAGTLIGVMVAVALMPPLVAFGVLGGAGKWGDALQALTLLLTNLICVNLASIGTFLFHGIYPSSSKWRDQRRARLVARIALLGWALLLTALLVFHFTLR